MQLRRSAVLVESGQPATLRMVRTYCMYVGMYIDTYLSQIWEVGTGERGGGAKRIEDKKKIKK